MFEIFQVFTFYFVDIFSLKNWNQINISFFARVSVGRFAIKE